MPEIPAWATGLGSGGLIYVVLRYFGPALKGSLNGQATQWRSENKYIAQLESARDRAFEERDAISKERDELFQNFATVNARFTILEQKFDDSQKQVALLTAKLDEAELQAAQLKKMVAQLTAEIQKLTRGLNATDH